MTVKTSTPTSTDKYPSRKGGTTQRLERKDPVVRGTPGDGPLIESEVSKYEQNGFLGIEGFLEDERLAACRQELARLRREMHGSDAEGVITEPSSKAVRSIFRVHRHDSVIGELARDPKLGAIARQLLGSDVYIHQSRINYKPGFRGKEFYWHSDFETWHVEDGMPDMRAVSMSISLTDNNVHNGPLLLIPGSHHVFIACPGETPEKHYESSLKEQQYGVPDDASLAGLVEDGGITAATGPAGSVMIFECNTMHGSNGNITPWPRSNVFMVFNSVENRVVEPFCGLEPRPSYLAEREDFTPLG